MVNTVIPARPFDFPYDGRLDPAAATLMVIDLQLDFLSPDGYLARKGYDPARCAPFRCREREPADRGREVRGHADRPHAPGLPIRSC